MKPRKKQRQPLELPAPHTASTYSVTPSRNASAACDNGSPAINRSASNVHPPPTIDRAPWVIFALIIARGIITAAADIDTASPCINGTAAIDPSAACNHRTATVDAAASISSSAASSIGNRMVDGGPFNDAYMERWCRRNSRS